MDFNDYIVEKLAVARLDELREQSARLALLAQARPGRRGVVSRLGAALTDLGQRLARDGVAGRNGGVRVARVR
jgi:hypothetical protein